MTHHELHGLYAHRVSYLLYVGAIPDGMLVDHTCHERSCVNPGHLRLATPKQNTENVSGLRSTNTSGFQGAYFHKKSGKWQATALHDGRMHHFGFHETAELAGLAAREGRNQLFTHNLIDRKGAA